MSRREELWMLLVFGIGWGGAALGAAAMHYWA